MIKVRRIPSYILLTALLANSVATPATASNPGSLDIAADLNRFATRSSATQMYSIAPNFNSLDAIKFESNIGYPRSVQITVRAFDAQQTQLDASNYTCNFYDSQSQSWSSQTLNATISRVSANSMAVTCEITATAAMQGQFEVGTARTNGNYGIVRYILPDFAQPGGGSRINRQAQSAPKYAGPEFSSFGAPILAGDKLVSQGKRLDGITSLKINGAAATFKVNSTSELEIDVPKDLAPGKYDIEITSTHGKLTHLQAFTVKAVVPTKTLEFKGDGRTLGYDELLELTKMAKQIGAEYTSVKCIVNAADAAVAQRLVSRGCDYVGAIRLRGKEVSTEAKSTYKGDGFWFKIVANG